MARKQLGAKPSARARHWQGRDFVDGRDQILCISPRALVPACGREARPG
jgi:hypothetical protein